MGGEGVLLWVVQIEFLRKPVYRNIKCFYSHLVVPHCVIGIFVKIYNTTISINYQSLNRLPHSPSISEHTLVMNRLFKKD